MKSLSKVAVMLAFASAGCDDGSGYQPLYSVCATANDCSAMTPECQPFALGGRTTSWCTSTCQESFDCPSTPSGTVWRPSVCIPVDASGAYDPASTTKVCVRGCATPGADSCGDPERECVALGTGLHDPNVCVPYR